MYLNKNQIAFILAGLDFFDKDDEPFEDGQYSLTSKECDELIQILKNKLGELK